MAHPSDRPDSGPAFQFYVKEWRSSRAVQRMSMSARGVYLEMLLEQWEKETLPDNAEEVAEIIATTDAQMAEVVGAWSAVRRKFVTIEAQPGRIQNVRLEKVREARLRFIEQNRENGRKGGIAATAARPSLNQGSSLAQVSPTSSTATATATASSTATPTAIATAEESGGGLALRKGNGDARSKHPIFKGQRLTVFEWQFSDLECILGEHTNGFDLHEWFFTIDAMAVSKGLVIPKRDGGAWLQDQLVSEAQRRGIPLKMAVPQSQTVGKLTNRMVDMVIGAKLTEKRR